MIRESCKIENEKDKTVFPAVVRKRQFGKAGRISRYSEISGILKQYTRIYLKIALSHQARSLSALGHSVFVRPSVAAGGTDGPLH